MARTAEEIWGEAVRECLGAPTEAEFAREVAGVLAHRCATVESRLAEVERELDALRAAIDAARGED